MCRKGKRERESVHRIRGDILNSETNGRIRYACDDEGTPQDEGHRSSQVDSERSTGAHLRIGRNWQQSDHARCLHRRRLDVALCWSLALLCWLEWVGGRRRCIVEVSPQSCLDQQITGSSWTSRRDPSSWSTSSKTTKTDRHFQDYCGERSVQLRVAAGRCPRLSVRK